MKTLSLLFVVFISSAFICRAGQVDSLIARNAAMNKVAGFPDGYSIDRMYENSYADITYYVFTLIPNGFIIISGQTELPPVYGWSHTCQYFPGGEFAEIAGYDLYTRSRCISSLPSEIIQKRYQAWEDLLAGVQERKEFIQYPPAGTTSTEGWLEENWTQNAPYNNMCPIDPVTSVRSIAGCPSIAMGSILNFHGTVNGVSFSDLDDYHHNYAGRNYYIDDDADTWDFPTFPQLNKLLDSAQAHYDNCTGADNIDKAALVWACGIACTQVYTSSGSGTFGVNQALEGYQKFNFASAELLLETTPGLYDSIMQNIIDTLPVHLAVVTPDWLYGHNVIIDGYNTDGYFHLNFGWGGSNNGWYGLPDEIPYGFTVIEGAVVDIIPSLPVEAPQISLSDKLLYPNPATDWVFIENNNEKYQTATLLSITGATLAQYKLQSGQQIINLPAGLEKGIYFIRLSGNNRTENFRVVVE